MGAGDLADYYNHDKISWEIELWRKDEIWDFMVDGAWSDEASFEKLQSYLGKAVHENKEIASRSRRQSVVHGSTAPAPYLSSDHLFEKIEGFSSYVSGRLHGNLGFV